MASFLLLGFFIGMSHALEADHLAAVGTLATNGKASPKALAFLGVSWGAGHTSMLLLMSLPVIAFGVVLSPSLAAGLELAVGVMLIFMGANVLRKIRLKKVHLHLHQHGSNIKHFHAHSHATSNHDAPENHDHEHVAGFSLRAFLIGLLHGGAGSAGLVALAVAATQNAMMTLVYILIFGLGSILGMALLTFSASWPLRLSEFSAGKIFRYVQIAVAGIAIFIGFNVIGEFIPVLRGAV